MPVLWENLVGMVGGEILDPLRPGDGYRIEGFTVSGDYFQVQPYNDVPIYTTQQWYAPFEGVWAVSTDSRGDQVPEPSSWMLATIGTLSLAWWANYTRSTAQ